MRIKILNSTGLGIEIINEDEDRESKILSKFDALTSLVLVKRIC